MRLTNTGALVLWNFLWALNLLLESCGKAKSHPGINWNKIRKILDLYLRNRQEFTIFNLNEYLF